MTTQSDERLVRDVVPAEVQGPDGSRWLRTRVFITDQRVLAFEEGRPPRLVLEAVLLDADVQSIHAPASRPHRLATADGDVLVRRARGVCSCQLPGLMAMSWPTTAGVLGRTEP